MGLHDNYRKVSDIRKYREKNLEEERRNKSKAVLKQLIEKKFKTCFIGSISSIEDLFGDKWGRDLKSNERTREQTEMFRLWSILRSEILDKGNVQLRSMLRELEDYDVDYKGKYYFFNEVE